ncbi:hypothetical protein [Streptomyces griseus]|uniref:hypothetical protein n=1 Tax=Streptomyces griseus TaxID=1911 RepID=UPI00068DE7B3|nr:hypothetical protein [Streptomyces griseus]
MERIIDLDEAASVLARRTPGWQAAGLEVCGTTWRDAEAAWPQPLETDRDRVRDPDSLGVVLRGPAEAELHVVLFRGGWADVDFAAGPEDFGCLPASEIVSAADFARRTDLWVARVFGGTDDEGAGGRG